MAQDMKDMQMEIGIEEALKEGKLMELEYINGPLVKSMMGIGPQVQKMVMECGKEPMEKFTLVNGKTQRLMDLVFIHGLTEISMKGSGKTF